MQGPTKLNSRNTWGGGIFNEVNLPCLYDGVLDLMSFRKNSSRYSKQFACDRNKFVMLFAKKNRSGQCGTKINGKHSRIWDGKGKKPNWTYIWLDCTSKKRAVAAITHNYQKFNTGTSAIQVQAK